MDREENRIIDPVTGGAKGQKLARFDLIPPVAMIALAEHFGRGASKYTDRNWELGYKWSLHFAALQRHSWLWWSGEDDDPDGSSHLSAIMWHAACLMEVKETHPEMDDRPATHDSNEQKVKAHFEDWMLEKRQDMYRTCPDIEGRDYKTPQRDRDA